MYSDPYGLCVIRMAGGVMEVAAGVSMIGGSSGICALPGYLMFINGIDNIMAGFGGLVTGEYKPAILEMGINALIPDSRVATVVYAATQVLIPASGALNICFVKGTLVWTKEGLKPIEELTRDDYVLSRNEKTGEIEYKRIVNIFVTPNQKVLRLSLEAEDGTTDILGVTPEHPFSLTDYGWTDAYKLLPGDEIFTSRGGWLKVTGSTWMAERQTVYNIEVEDFHTYFVGETGAWVHNVCKQVSTFALPNIYKKAAGVEGKFSDIRYSYRLDTNKVAFGEGGFHVHVYFKGNEVAKVSGNGKWVKQHGGNTMLKPSEAPRPLRTDVNRLIRNAQKHIGE
ncbi:MAG: hypothetical protein HQK76_20865 [Desulfobacterales bacterium]|nr:hypothetical protein [Desulfobacterales bacterium]